MVKCKDCGRTVNDNEVFFLETDAYDNPDGGLCESCYNKKYTKKCSKCGQEFADSRANSSLCPECVKKILLKKRRPFFVVFIASCILLFIIFYSILSNINISCGKPKPKEPKYKNAVDRYINDDGFRDFVNENKAYEK